MKREKLLKYFKDEKEATKEKFTKVKNMIPENNLERAYRYYYLNRITFSGKMKSIS